MLTIPRTDLVCEYKVVCVDNPEHHSSLRYSSDPSRMYYSRSGSGTNQDPGQDIDSPEVYIPCDERLGKNKISCMKRRVFLKRFGSSISFGTRSRLPRFTGCILPIQVGPPSRNGNALTTRSAACNLIPVDFPLNGCMSSSQCAECQALLANLRIPI